MRSPRQPYQVNFGQPSYSAPRGLETPRSARPRRQGASRTTPNELRLSASSSGSPGDSCADAAQRPPRPYANEAPACHLVGHDQCPSGATFSWYCRQPRHESSCRACLDGHSPTAAERPDALAERSASLRKHHREARPTSLAHPLRQKRKPQA